MTIRMTNLDRLTLAEMRELLTAQQGLSWKVEDQPAAYRFIEQTLKQQGYRKLSKGQKGIVRRFLSKVTGMSRAQVNTADSALEPATSDREEADATPAFSAALLRR